MFLPILLDDVNLFLEYSCNNVNKNANQSYQPHACNNGEMQVENRNYQYHGMINHKTGFSRRIENTLASACFW